MSTCSVQGQVNRPRSRQRSRITNGTALVPGVSGRSAWTRRCKDVIELQVIDLGGEANTSVAERSIVRRAAVLTVQLEMLEARFAEGRSSDADIDLYIRGSGNLRRLLESVGLQRRQKDVTPTLSEYLKGKAAAQTEPAE